MVTSIYRYDREGGAHTPDLHQIDNLDEARHDSDSGQDDVSFEKLQADLHPFKFDTLSVSPSNMTPPPGWGFNPYPYLVQENGSQDKTTASATTPVETTKQGSAFWSFLKSLWPFGETAKTIEPVSEAEDQAVLDNYKLDTMETPGAFHETEIPPQAKYGWENSDTISQPILSEEETFPTQTPSFWDRIKSVGSWIVSYLPFGSSETTQKVEAAPPSTGYFDSIYTAVTDRIQGVKDAFNSYWYGKTEEPVDPRGPEAFDKMRLGSEFLAPLSPSEKKEMARLVSLFHRLMAKLREGLSEAEIERLMETVLQLARENKNEEFSLQKAAVIRKQEGLRDEQIHRLKEVDKSIELLRRNRWWNVVQDWAAVGGYAMMAAGAGAKAVPLALLYVSYKKFTAGDWAEKGVSKLVGALEPWTGLCRTIGITNPAEVERYAYQRAQQLIGMVSMLAAYQFKPAATSFTVVIQAITTLIKGGAMYYQGQTGKQMSLKEGEIKYQAHKIEEAQKSVDEEMRKFADTFKRQVKFWELSGKHMRNLHEAKISMLH